jgi:hypothetical protein
MNQQTYDWIKSQFSTYRQKQLAEKMCSDVFFSEVIYRVADWIEQGVIIKHYQEPGKAGGCAGNTQQTSSRSGFAKSDKAHGLTTPAPKRLI